MPVFNPEKGLLSGDWKIDLFFVQIQKEQMFAPCSEQGSPCSEQGATYRLPFIIQRHFLVVLDAVGMCLRECKVILVKHNVDYHADSCNKIRISLVILGYSFLTWGSMWKHLQYFGIFKRLINEDIMLFQGISSGISECKAFNSSGAIKSSSMKLA